MKDNIKLFIVLVACMSADGDFLEKGKVLELDKDKDEKIISLGLVEEYDEDKHKNQTKTNPELEALIAENESLKEKVAALENPELEALNSTIEDLKNLVVETSKLPKDKLPEGFAKYQKEV